MALIIVKAENDFLKDAAFRLRYKIFGEEQTVFETNEEKKLSDRFDKCPSTSNYVCFLDERPVASFRVSVDGPLGFPVEEHYDLSPIENIRKHSKVGLISLGCIEKDVRSSGVYPLCVYKMGKILSDKSCDYGAVVIRKELSASFEKWGFTPIEHFYCDRVSRWLSKMYVDIKNFGKNQSHFAGTEKVPNFKRKMTIHLNNEEIFHFSQLNRYNINFTHLRLVSGEIKLLYNGTEDKDLNTLELHPYTQEMNSLDISLRSKRSSELECLIDSSSSASS